MYGVSPAELRVWGGNQKLIYFPQQPSLQRQFFMKQNQIRLAYHNLQV
jgi:hypothetical protein